MKWSYTYIKRSDLMGLKREIQEELEEETFREGERRIMEKYYTDPDESMRGFASSALHKSILGEYEPSESEKRVMELELENYRLRHGHNDD